jgi:hypothetical protein
VSPSKQTHLKTSDSRERLLHMNNRKASVLISEGPKSRECEKEKEVRLLTCATKVFQPPT